MREGAQDAHEAIRPTVGAPDAGLVRRRPQARRAAALPPDLGALRRLADGAGGLRSDDRRHRCVGRATRSARPGSVLKFAGFTRVYEEGRDDATAAGPTEALLDGKRTAAAEADRRRAARPARASTPSSTSPSRRRASPKRRSCARSRRTGSAGRRPTARSSRRSRRAATSSRSSAASTRPRSAFGQRSARRALQDIVDLEASRRRWNASSTASPRTATTGSTCCGASTTSSALELAAAEEKLPKFEQRDEPTDEICPNCGRPMVIKTGRFGKFISCTGYPECKTTQPILKDTGAKCPKDGGMVVERKSRTGPHVLRLRQLSEVRLRLVGPRRSRTVPGLRRLRRRQSRSAAATTRFECHTDKTHDTSRDRRRAAGARKRSSNPSRTAMPGNGHRRRSRGLRGGVAARRGAACACGLYERRPHIQRSGASHRHAGGTGVQQLAARRGARELRSGCSKKSWRGSIR